MSDEVLVISALRTAHAQKERKQDKNTCIVSKSCMICCDDDVVPVAWVSCPNHVATLQRELQAGVCICECVRLCVEIITFYVCVRDKMNVLVIVSRCLHPSFHPTFLSSQWQVHVSWAQPHNFQESWMTVFCAPHLHPPHLSNSFIHPPVLTISITLQLDEQSGSGYQPGPLIDCAAAERASLYLCRVYCFFHLRRN